MSGALRAVGLGLVALLLVGALVLPFVGGYPLAYALMALTLLLTVWQLFTGRIRLTPAAVLFGTAFLLLAVAFATTGDLRYALNFSMFLFYAPLAAALGRFSSPRSATIVAILALAGSIVAMAFALWQVYGLGMPRAAGIQSDPIWAAQAALIGGFLALVGLWSGRGWRHIFWLGPTLGLLVVFLCGARGPAVAMPLLLLIGMIFAFAPRWWLAIPAAIGSLAIAVFGLSTISPSALHRLESIPLIFGEVALGEPIGETSASQRLMFYGASWQAFLEAPVFGHGWSRRIDAVRPFTGDAMLAEGHHHLHSDPADFAVSAGILGIVAYLLVLLAPLVDALRRPRDALFRPRLLGALLLSVGYLACGVTYLMFGYELHTTLYVVLAAIVCGYLRMPSSAAGPSARP